MDTETVDLDITDWNRILFGEAPAEFLLEVFIRGFSIYFVLLLVLQAMGKRMTGQLALADFAIMITMGGIVSVPMQVPERGILQGILVLFCALFFHQSFNFFARKSTIFEDLTQGKVSMLVKDGIIQREAMKDNKISQQQLFAALRNKGIYNLGMARRVYLEAYGLFSIYRYPDDRPGLCIVPTADRDCEGIKKLDADGRLACAVCGSLANGGKNKKSCEFCESEQFEEAII